MANDRNRLVVIHANEGYVVTEIVEQLCKTVGDANPSVLIRIMSPHEFVVVHLAEGGEPDFGLVLDDCSPRIAVVVAASQDLT